MVTISDQAVIYMLIWTACDFIFLFCWHGFKEHVNSNAKQIVIVNCVGCLSNVWLDQNSLWTKIPNIEDSFLLTLKTNKKHRFTSSCWTNTCYSIERLWLKVACSHDIFNHFYLSIY